MSRPVAGPVDPPLAASKYGHFTAGGAEYLIVDPRTPRPWINLIANPRVGLAVSQTGSGFSWIDNSQLAAIVRWQQDLAEDRSGRFLYVRDDVDGTVWSLSPAPCWPVWDHYACRHGLGYTTFETCYHGIVANWTLFVDAEAAVEMWRVSLRAPRPRRLTIVAFIEWNCGTSPAPRREFQKLFLETVFDPGARAILATSHMWDVASARWGHWNTSFPYWSAFAAAQAVERATGDKAAFLGRCGRWSCPAALEDANWPALFGRHHDPVAALACPVRLEASVPWDGGFLLATAASQEEALGLCQSFNSAREMDRSLGFVTSGWKTRLAAHRMTTPDATLDVLANDWLRYQAISARLWGRAGYYQQSGAFGFRDQLQDSQVWLTIDPDRCRDQLRLHAAHQFADGSVVHWWHPLTEQGHVTQMTDDLLWLGFVTANYIKETGDFSVLAEPARFLDDTTPAPLVEHVSRAFGRAFSRMSGRGLPFIGAGDWNDGLSAVGLQEKGESVWLAMFLAGLLDDWAVIHDRRGAGDMAAAFRQRRLALIAAVNEHAWDGAWYRRATLDEGGWLGSAGNTAGRIYLNAQTWALLNDIAPHDRAQACLAAIRQHLVTPQGALLLAPAYERPDERIGYITRYAPGLRENGGVYTHAATWAIAAAARVKDADLVERLLDAINPARQDPERFWAEPYVLPGNVDGPASPRAGRGGWTWYTGSAAWLPRVIAEWVLGVRPTWEGLCFDPCLPPRWNRARMVRPWRGATLDVAIERRTTRLETGVEVAVNGRPLPARVLPCVERGSRYVVEVGVA